MIDLRNLSIAKFAIWATSFTFSANVIKNLSQYLQAGGEAFIQWQE